MHLQLIRNATLCLNYGGQRLLIDPALDPRSTRPPLAGLARNPTTDLPELGGTTEITEANLILVSHLHADHFDDAARAHLSATTPMLCQPDDEANLRAAGFQDVTSLEHVMFRGISIQATPGQHGSGAILARMGSVMGFILRAAGEPTVYWAGDTILTPGVLEVVEREQPALIVTHSGGAVLGGELLIMDAAQTVALGRAAPESRIVAVHLEALDHCTVSRAGLRAAWTASGLPATQLLIPQDGETLFFSNGT